METKLEIQKDNFNDVYEKLEPALEKKIYDNSCKKVRDSFNY